MWTINPSRRQAIIMDGNRRVSSIEDLPSQFLDMGVDQLPGQLLETLGLKLFNEGRGVAGNWEGVAEELGIQTTDELEQIRRHAHRAQVFPGRLMLSDWGKKKGSTVFVLLTALRRQNREDCIEQVLKACQDAHSMQLIVKIEEVDGHQQFITVTTKKESSLAASLENVLSGLSSYVITGPNDKLTWQTPAYHLKGQQLSLKKGEVTEESARNVYGPLQISQQKSRVPVLHDDSLPPAPSYPYSTPSIPVPLNIPVEDPSVSNNFVSGTDPKVHVHDMLSHTPPPSYNDLSMTNHSMKHPQDFQSLLSNPHFTLKSLVSEGPSPAERQTLLKKAAYSVDESMPRFPTLHSMTTAKQGYPSSLQQFRTGSLDEQNSPLSRCDPLRHSDNPTRQQMRGGDYIPHTHPMINFSNPDHQGFASPKCRAPAPCVTNESYVRQDSIMSTSSARCRPPPCDKQSIHVHYDNFPNSGPVKANVITAPVPCVLQQRKDGYIDIVERQRLAATQYARQQSMPAPASMDTSEVTMKVRPQSVPDINPNTGGPSAQPPQCVVQRDSNGYATFSLQQSQMEVESEEGSAGSGLFSCPVNIDVDADGYLSYSEGSINAEDMESDGSAHTVSNNNPVLIQQSTDGYFGFGTSTSSSSSVPAPCEGAGYIHMNRSESLPNDGLVYARFSEEDEEEDADYFDMKQLPNLPGNAKGKMNRHWSEGDIQYNEMNPTPSQYDYINGTERPQSRTLPPRPSQSGPMKRRRVRPAETESRGDVRQSSDLDTVPGWCSQESEESIPKTMKRYQQEDGNFIVWWMERKSRYVITVSHMGELRHYAVYERVNGSRSRFFVFQGAEEFDNLKKLVEHYMKEGLKGPDVASGQNRGKRWQQFSHVRLRKPLKVKYTHTVVRKKAT